MFDDPCDAGRGDSPGLRGSAAAGRADIASRKHPFPPRPTGNVACDAVGPFKTNGSPDGPFLAYVDSGAGVTGVGERKIPHVCALRA